MASNLRQFQDRSFHYQPVDYLLAVVDSKSVAEAAIRDLLAAEFPGHCQLNTRKTLAQAVLERHAAHFLTFLSLGTVEVLKP